MTWSRLGRNRPNRERGQSLVEFALIAPIFLMLVVGLIEFAVAFSVQLNVNYASRDSALLAAEAGSGAGADCIILQAVEKDLGSPSDKTSIQQVRVYWASPNGVEKAANVYSRSGTTSCTLADGTIVTVPYSASSTAYPESSRCTYLAGCGGTHTQLDQIGVSISYQHGWITPVPGMVRLPASGVTITRSNSMRMEPTL